MSASCVADAVTAASRGGKPPLASVPAFIGKATATSTEAARCVYRYEKARSAATAEASHLLRVGVARAPTTANAAHAAAARQPLCCCSNSEI